ncbi:magnesium transporter CorA family protein [Paenibacillus sp. R14(2021)]|uniref:magnesium transporter CorA family protein n=1 Tax=Paenibacillus sp. R14(2021) TaxID=2859228 RepID=UPI001C615CCE|nr:magnesium transporter CorA family protein [Paenibacillus sp. R14(2021)]
MMHRLLHFPSQWEWHMLHAKRPDSFGLSRSGKSAARTHAPGSSDPLDTRAAAELTNQQFDRELAAWLQEVEDCTHNQISVTELPGGHSLLHGTLMYQVSDDMSDIVPLHFRITNEKLVTYQHDMRLSVRLQNDPWQEKLHRCKAAPEGFFVMLSLILETFHTGLDLFETRLGELESKMSRHNRTGLMNTIFERRYELLHWSHLFIPIKEINNAAKEAFMDELEQLEEFKRMELKLDRIQNLLNHYAMEIDTLLMMDDAISNFRGNDIMKTLTIFTALFMPATVIGAIWGMNFNSIPWASEPWGFIAVSSFIVVTTLLIYWWLWNKGWTGDLLNGRSNRGVVGNRNADAARSSHDSGAGVTDQPLVPRRDRAAGSLTTLTTVSKDTSAPMKAEDVGLPSRSSR